MKKLLCIAVLIFSTGAATAGFHGGTGNYVPLTNSFQDLQVGGGGLTDGQDVATTDSTQAHTSRCMRTDTNGAYCWDWTSSQWCQVVSQISMPAANFGYYPLNTTTTTGQIHGGDVYEIAAAPGNPDIGYMMYGGNLYKTSNLVDAENTNCDSNQNLKVSWALTSIVSVPGTDAVSGNNAYFSSRTLGRRMAVDPNNSSVVWIGTPSSGLIVTTSGGATYSTISSSDIPNPSAGTAFGSAEYIAFDKASGTSACTYDTASGNCTNDVYVWSYGHIGLYVSTGGGATGTFCIAGSGSGSCSTSSSGPAQNSGHLVVAPCNSAPCKVWLVDINGVTGVGQNLWTYSGGYAGTWTEALSEASNSGITAVAVDPNNPTTNIVASQSAAMQVSTNGSTFTSYTITRGTADAPWQSLIDQSIGANDLSFDPTASGPEMLWMNAGQGVWKFPFQSSAITLTGAVGNIENLVGLNVVVPTAGSPVIGAEDEGVFNPVPNASPCCTGYFATPNSLSTGLILNNAYGVDYAAGTPSYVAALGTQQGAGSGTYDGYTTNGGPNLLPFNDWYTIVPGTALTNDGGLVEVNLAAATAGQTTSSGLTAWSAGSGSIITSVCVGTKGATLSNIGQANYEATSLPDSSHMVLNVAYTSSYTNNCPSYIMYVTPPTLLTDRFGSLGIANVTSSGGAIELTTNFSAAFILTGNPICVYNVTGTIEANGCWIVTSASGSNIVLKDSVFTHTFTGGGYAATWQNYGGYLAVSSSTNMVVVHNNDYPFCTTDGGQTWSLIDMNQPGNPGYVPPNSADFPLAISTVGFTATVSGTSMTGVTITSGPAIGIGQTITNVTGEIANSPTIVAYDSGTGTYTLSSTQTGGTGIALTASGVVGGDTLTATGTAVGFNSGVGVAASYTAASESFTATFSTFTMTVTSGTLPLFGQLVTGSGITGAPLVTATDVGGNPDVFTLSVSQTGSPTNLVATDALTNLATGLAAAVNASSLNTVVSASVIISGSGQLKGVLATPTTNIIPHWTFTSTGAETAPLAPANQQWLLNYFDYNMEFAADRVTPNTFYMFNPLMGIFKMTNCGTPTLVNSSNAYNNDTGFYNTWANGATGLYMFLKAVPGEAGHFFFGNGQAGVFSSGFSHSCNSGTTLVRTVNMFGPLDFGFGKPASGAYPDIYYVGWYTPDNISSHATYGVYRISGDPNDGLNGVCNGGGQVSAQIGGTGNTSLYVSSISNGYNLGIGDVITYSTNGNVSASTTITGFGPLNCLGGSQAVGSGGVGCYTVNNAQTVASETMVFSPYTITCLGNPNIAGQCPSTPPLYGYPRGSMHPVNDISGDMNVYGTVYGSFGGGGFWWGSFNYLLNRDLDPASNDNSPAFLDKAA